MGRKEGRLRRGLLAESWGTPLNLDAKKPSLMTRRPPGDVTSHTLKAEQSDDSDQFGHGVSAVSSCLPITWAQIQSAAAPTAEQPE